MKIAGRAFLHLLCALLLLVAQHGAITHAVWHLHDHLPGHGQQHDAGARFHQDGDEPAPQSRLCDLHSAINMLLAGDCGTQSALAPDATEQALAPVVYAWRSARPATAPPARAPPLALLS